MRRIYPAVLCLLLCRVAAPQLGPWSSILSQDTTGSYADDSSQLPCVSGDGAYAVYHSYASDLIVGDTNGVADVFVQDITTRQITRVNMDVAGGEANGHSLAPSPSQDCRYVAFYSYASDLVAGDTNGTCDVFVRDRQAGQTVRASVDSSGNQGNGISKAPRISANGRYVAFASTSTNLVPGDTNNADDIFVHDRQTGETTRVSVGGSGEQANGHSGSPTISADGRLVAFVSIATNLVAGDTNRKADVFLHDRATGQTTRESVSSSGDQGNGQSDQPSLSGNGGHLAFRSEADNLAPGDDSNRVGDIFVRHLSSGETEFASLPPWSDPWWPDTGLPVGYSPYGGSDLPTLNYDGRFVAFWSDRFVAELSGLQEGETHVYVRDLHRGSAVIAHTELLDDDTAVPHRSAPGLSDDGRVLVCTTADWGPQWPNGRDDVLLRELWAAATDFAVDGMIFTGAGYAGDEVFNTTGEMQTHTRATPVGTHVIHAVRFYNDGNVADRFRITGPAGNAKWRVQYYSIADGADITAAVTGEGWLSPAVAAGSYCQLRLAVTPLPGASPNAAYEVLVMGTSFGNGSYSPGDTAKRDAVKAITTCSLTYRPDGMIWDGGGYLGDEVFSATGAGQTANGVAKAKGSTEYLITFVNDGNVPDSLRITGGGGNARFGVRYLEYWTAADVTAQVTGAGWVPGPAAPQRSYRLKLVVTPVPGAIRSGYLSTLVTATSQGDPTRLDTVQAVTIWPEYYQPDGQIWAGSTYIGDDIYNTTGAGQSTSLSVALGGTAAFYPRLYNDGNSAERLIVTGTGGNSKWAVTYLEYWSGGDVTAQVTGAGWTTPAVAPGGSVRLRVLITPGAGSVSGEAITATITATSEADATKKDTVKAQAVRR